MRATKGIEATVQQLAILSQTGEGMPVHGNIPAIMDGLDQKLAMEIGEQYERIPEKQRAYLSLACLGWSTRQIARSFNVCQTTVQEALNKYDPERICRGNPKTALVIRGAMALRAADMILLSITSEDMEKAGLKDKAIAYDKLQGRGVLLLEKATVGTKAREAAQIEAMMAEIKNGPESKKLVHS
jgi:hypothetical protein